MPRGRPKGDNSKTKFIKVYLTEKEYEEIKYLAYLKEQSVSEFARKGVKMQCNLTKNTI